MSVKTIDLGSKFLEASVGDGVMRVRLNRPEKRNSTTQETYRGLKRAAILAAEDPDGLAHELDHTDHNRRLPEPDINMFRQSIMSPELMEGLKAFLEKRPARWPRD